MSLIYYFFYLLEYYTKDILRIKNNTIFSKNKKEKIKLKIYINYKWILLIKKKLQTTTIKLNKKRKKSMRKLRQQIT